MTDPDRRALLDDLQQRREEAQLGGGKKRIEAQHAKNKLTARERLDILLDEGSFEELGMFVRHQSHDFGLDKQRRSEEHTSELQSRGHLVCRLLLEKKKQEKQYI